MRLLGLAAELTAKTSRDQKTAKHPRHTVLGGTVRLSPGRGGHAGPEPTEHSCEGVAKTPKINSLKDFYNIVLQPNTGSSPTVETAPPAGRPQGELQPAMQIHKKFCPVSSSKTQRLSYMTSVSTL